MKHFIAESEEELVEKVYEELRDKFKTPFRVALTGDLGAGKTTLVKGLLKKLGVADPVTSPTFIIRKNYQADSAKFQHLDLYRYSRDIDSREIEEYINDPEYISFIEWPENIGLSLSSYDAQIKLKSISDSAREVEIECD